MASSLFLHESLKGSADWQSAVSPIANRQGIGGLNCGGRGASRRVTRAKGPAHTSLGQSPVNAPGEGAPKTTPSANGAAQFPKSLSAGLVPPRASKPFSGVSEKNNTRCCCQCMTPKSTSVMPGIEMERAFSALASAVRLPSPLGWYDERLWRSSIHC